MEDKLRNEVRKVLSEEMGVQQDIKVISSGITDEVVNQLKLNKDKISDGYTYELTANIRTNSTQKKNTNINNVVVNINYQKIDKNKTNGSFNSKKTKLQEDGSYVAYIELNLESPNIEDVNTTKINLIISHELNHAFVYLKKFKLQPKTPIYNKVKNKMLPSYQHIEPLKRFLIMFYLNLPEEIQARVQEVGSILPNIEADNYNDTVQELYFYQPINDAKRMAKYNSSDLYELPMETLNLFVERFNKEVLYFKDKLDFKEIEFKVITEPKKFFDYWTKFINFGGVKLNKKILNLVAKKFKINEDNILNELNESLLFEIFNIDLNL